MRHDVDNRSGDENDNERMGYNDDEFLSFFVLFCFVSGLQY